MRRSSRLRISLNAGRSSCFEVTSAREMNERSLNSVGGGFKTNAAACEEARPARAGRSRELPAAAYPRGRYRTDEA